ncbi:MAG: hypothetical protein WAT12_07090 [Candidatus Nitrotoga sp.]
MENKFASVKNPLTVIAIFAGIAEVSGSAVLPLIAPANQTLYIWFLMLFPFTLIAVFFLTLNFNHRVLYAPSDFKDEDNFVNILKKSTYNEVLEYKTKEAIVFESEEPLEQPIQQLSEVPAVKSTLTADTEHIIPHAATMDKLIMDAETAMHEVDTVSTRAQREQLDLIARQISERRMRDMRLAEKLALEALEKELGVSIDREMKIEAGTRRFHFDGIVRRGSSLTAIEVKYFRSQRSSPMNMMMWQELRRSLEALFQSLSEEQQRDFSFVLVIVHDNEATEIEHMVARRLAEFPFPTAIKMYNFDELVASQI